MTHRDRFTWARRLIAAGLAVTVSGCSFVSVRRPTPRIEVEDPRQLDACTTAPAAPVLDTVLAAAGLVAGYVAMVVSLMESADCIETTTARCDSGSPAPGLALFGAGALFTGSAVYGHVSTARCRRRVAAGGRCADGDLGACQRLKPGWTPPEWRTGPGLAPWVPPTPPTVTPASAPEWTPAPPQPEATPPAPPEK
jgi:hypothetical protein